METAEHHLQSMAADHPQPTHLSVKTEMQQQMLLTMITSQSIIQMTQMLPTSQQVLQYLAETTRATTTIITQCQQVRLQEVHAQPTQLILTGRL
ncbi:hypothetical protein A3C28_05290 [Candidatus Roizmanbacteria bacterium RIFCSPHIGHO2_02_FULL_39_9]|uniref:Uncharacterized protein n=1 Tax=Candidatus Roizmanbacteria bacterium RIFCSPHIGHO2_02_FULL_39_9 TaxID=1802040 RepID=A0A1F7H3F9_9BACT|nr:MAG: hypothetical protein A3C28_05290 [Candidatus Roizmanbacteria bacterium RIFCSPHIGHO2_02_FULL_39_9]